MDKTGIYLRKIEFHDAALVAHWENTVEGWNMEENAEPYSVLDIMNLVREMEDVERAAQIRYMICHGDLAEPIGVADLTEMDFEAGRSSVGILIAEPSFRNKGFASHALSLLEIEARTWKINQLISTVLESNESSIKLFTRMGYKKIDDAEEGYVVQATYIKAIILKKWLNAD